MQNSSIFQLYLSYYYFIDPSISTSFSILKVKKINQNYLLKKERNYRYAKRCIENNSLMIARGKKKTKEKKRGKERFHRIVSIVRIAINQRGPDGGKKLARIISLVSSLTHHSSHSIHSNDRFVVDKKKEKKEERERKGRKETERTANEDIEDRSSSSISQPDHRTFSQNLFQLFIVSQNFCPIRFARLVLGSPRSIFFTNSWLIRFPCPRLKPFRFLFQRNGN